MARCWPPRRLDARRCAEDEGATQEITSAAWESRDQVQTACSLRMFYDVPPWRCWWSCCWKRNQWWSWKSVDTAPELSRMFWIWTATILLPLMLFGTANRTIEVPKMDHKWLGHAGSLMATNTRNTIFLMAHITNFRPVFGHVFPHVFWPTHGHRRPMPWWASTWRWCFKRCAHLQMSCLQRGNLVVMDC